MPPLAVATEMVRKRIYELAKEWGVPSHQILAELATLGHEEKKAQSSLTEEEAQQVKDRLGLTPTPATARPTVLVVDDDPQVVDTLTRFLARHGMATRAAYNGRECLEQVRQETVDIIVLDVVMPGMSGLEVCAALKDLSATRSIPIILLTARDDLETRLQAVRLGVSELVLKPVRGKDLLALIHTHLEVSRKARETEQALRRAQPKPHSRRH